MGGIGLMPDRPDPPPPPIVLPEEVIEEPDTLTKKRKKRSSLKVDVQSSAVGGAAEGTGGLGLPG